MLRGLLGAVIVLSLAAPARAQGARELFEQGAVALESGRFPEARDLLTRSLELHPHRATAFNLIVALRGTEQPVEALVLCARLLGGELGEVSGDRREQARTICEEVERMVARVVVVPSGAPELEVRVDGVPRGAVRDGASLEEALDPGRHVIIASAPEHAPAERSVVLSAGETLRLEMPLFELARPDTDELPSGAPSDLPIWLGTIGGVLLAGAIVGIIVAAYELSQPLPPMTSPDFASAIPTLRSATVSW